MVSGANLSVLGALGLAVGIIYLVHHKQTSDRKVMASSVSEYWSQLHVMHTLHPENARRGTEGFRETAKKAREQETTRRASRSS